MNIKQTLRKMKWIYPLLSRMRWIGGRFAMRFFNRFCGIDSNVVLFSSYSGRSYSDNPRVVSEKLHALCPDANIVWQMNKNADISDMPDYVKVIPAHSLRALKAYSTARVFVDNMNRPHYMLKFPGQYYIQTWHGDRGFKKVLFDMGTNERFPDGAQMDLAVSGSDFGSRVYRSSLRYEGEILEIGCPRNDILVKNPPETAAQVRRELGIPEDVSILMYAPTFRNKIAGSKISALLSLENLRVHIESVTGKKWICLSRGHMLTKGVNSDAAIDVSSYPDTSKLLLITDILISDYSSIAGDFMLLGRPAIFYQPDLQDYLSERGLYFNPDESPLVVAHSEEELLDILAAPRDWAQNCRDVLDFFGSHETGRASEIITERISAILKNKKA